MYKMLDWEGWSFWRFEYDIYEGEGAKVHITNNLMNGFISQQNTQINIHSVVIVFLEKSLIFKSLVFG